MSDVLRSRFRGALVGQAVGDACGFPLEGLPPARCRERAEQAVRGELARSEAGFAFGQVTDDTQMALAIARSLAERGAADPQDIAERFGALWSEGRIVGQGLACRTAVLRILDGAGWDQAGAPEGRAGNGAAMRTAPVGLFFYQDIPQLDEAADRIARITHRDLRARAGAVAVSRAVAHLVQGGEAAPPALVEAVCPGVERLHPLFAGLIAELPARMQAQPDETVAWLTTAGFTDGGTDGWEGVTPYVIPTVLAAFHALLRHPEDFREALRFVIACGGDVDTTGAITGALAGGHLGLEAVPEDLAHRVNDRGRAGHDELCNLADRLQNGSPTLG